MAEEEYRNLIKNLGFKTVSRLTPASCVVYQVKDMKRYRIIKFSAPSDKWTLRHILKENEALKRAQGIDGIVQRIEFYDQRKLCQLDSPYGDVVGLLKEYIPGKTLEQIKDSAIRLPKAFITGSENQKMLESAVKELHQRGIAYLDLTPRNIIISQSKKPYIIDPGTAILKEEVSKIRFLKEKQRDLKCLEWLLKYPRSSIPYPWYESD